jgi:hypothetical protein
MSKADLLKAIRDRKAEVVAEHAKATERYEREKPHQRRRLAAELRRIAKAIEAGRNPKELRYAHEVRVDNRFVQPSKPRLNTAKYDRDIAFLSRSTKEAFVLSQDALEHYLR